MAFGLSPKDVQTYSLENLTTPQFLVLAIEAANKLNWNISYKSEVGFIAHTKFSMSSSGEEIKVSINDHIAAIKSECIGNQILDYGKNKRNTETFLATLVDLKREASEEWLAQKYEELKPDLVSKDEDVYSQPPSTTKEKITGFFSIFIPREGYYITPILINLNIAVFILMAISGVSLMLPESEDLIKWGANFKPVTLDGQGWRLLTCCFIHIGIFHLLMNMYALLYIGVLLEPYLGKTRFAAAYLLTGIISSVASLWWHDLTVSAGASGAIFGMYGVFLAMLTTDLIEKSARKALLTSIGIFVAYNLMNGIKGGIDNAAHVGGLICGLIIGYAYLPSLRKPDMNKLKYSTVTILTVLIVSTSIFVYGRIPNDIGQYQEKMTEFSMQEERALAIYKLPSGTHGNVIRAQIKDTGIYYWNKNIQLLKEVDRLNIPDDFHIRNKKLVDYCLLRIKSCDLLYKSLGDNGIQYNDELINCNKEIEEAMNNLK